MDKLELAKLFQKAAGIRENSYDWSRSKAQKEAADKAGNEWYPDNSYYLKTHHDAVVEACGVEHADLVGLIYPALYSAWNDVLEWAFSLTGVHPPIAHHPDRPLDFGKEVQNVPTKCPYCLSFSDTGIDVNDVCASPTEGAIGICIECGEAAIYQGNPLQLRKITQEELDRMPADTLMEISRYKQAAHAVKLAKMRQKQNEGD